MYGIIKTVIESGRYELSDMLKKIDTIWLQGGLTEEQRRELVDLAREHAIPENSYASMQKQIDVLFQNYAELAREILELKNGGESPEPEEWPEYVHPTSVHDAYNTGDKITYNGKHYVCQMDSCVWDPDDYPAGWRETE